MIRLRQAPKLSGLFLFFLLTSSSCSGPEGNLASAVVTDSAGVQIVENRADPEALPVFAEFDPEPLAEIGVEAGNPEQEFGRIADALLLPGERVLVADGQASRLSLFSFQGELLWTYGGEGEGPGEFRLLQEIGNARGDSVGVWDRRLARVTVTSTSSGGFRDFTLRDPERGRPTKVEFLPSGSFLVSYTAAGRARPGALGAHLLSDSTTFILVDPDGGEIAILGTFLGGRRFSVVEKSASVYSVAQGTQPFSPGTEGEASSAEIFLSASETGVTQVFDTAGSLRRIVRAPTLTQALTDSDVEEYEGFRFGLSDGTPAALEAVEDHIATLTFPEVRPAFSESILEDDGHLWLNDYRPDPEMSTRWYVFKPSGVIAGTADFPAGSVIHDIVGSFVLLQPPHEMDVPLVRIHRIERR